MNNFVVIPAPDEDGDFEEEYKRYIPSLCETTRSVFDEIIEEKNFNLCCVMTGCESPIEQIMALRLYEYQNNRMAIGDYYNQGIDIVDIHNQYVINIEKKIYRADFAIAVWDCYLKEGLFFIIECDGHDFHEKTKEQAKRDKQRDRDILASGMYVMRYTGSEIYNNRGIADEIFKNIKSIIINRRKQRQ